MISGITTGVCNKVVPCSWSCPAEEVRANEKTKKSKSVHRKSVRLWSYCDATEAKTVAGNHKDNAAADAAMSGKCGALR